MILKREGNAVAAQFRFQFAFNQGFRLKAAFVLGKCQSDAFRTVCGSTGGIDPDDFGRQEAFGVIGDFNGE